MRTGEITKAQQKAFAAFGNDVEPVAVADLVAELTDAHLKALANGDASHLAASGVREAAPSRRDGHGMCGRREEYETPGATLPRGGERRRGETRYRRS
ncbi:hypothetical protein [Amycolatopsis minnesotensis]|uniref:Uncharacterized protein n=1 Tax=Amycolatopsis minnesotensis TaxID=337894 RepID=A0ABN2QCB1_9PSEU